MTNPKQILTGAAVLVLALTGPAFADETDNFTCRGRLNRDSLHLLDAWVNGEIHSAVIRANSRSAGTCDAACLFRELQSGVGANYRHPLTAIPHSRFEKWIRRHDQIDRCRLAFKDSIYGARAYDQPWLFPVTGRIIFLADSIRLNGRTVGLDKINHFIREGLAHRRSVAEARGDIRAVLRQELGRPGRPLAMTEHGLKGLSLTGVLAYADLAAGYSGFRFWTDLLSLGQLDSFVTYDALRKSFGVGRQFSFAAYVNDGWDETINCSSFDPELAREVAAALRRRSMTCSPSARERLAGLPNADLYVNPEFLEDVPSGSRHQRMTRAVPTVQ